MFKMITCLLRFELTIYLYMSYSVCRIIQELCLVLSQAVHLRKITHWGPEAYFYCF